MVHLVYKITNKINGHYYIGVHSTKNIEDGYMGSGTLIRRAVKKYGVRNFTREILFVFDTRDEAYAKEEELVNINLLQDPDCYNLVYGGNGPKCRPFYSVKAETLIYVEEYSPPFDKNFEYKVDLLKPVRLNDENLTSFGKAFWGIIVSPQLLDTITTLYNKKVHNDLANKYISLLERIPAFKNNIAIYRYPKTTLNHWY